MRFAQLGRCVALVLLGGGCGDRAAPDNTAAATETSSSASSLACDEAEQRATYLDVPGPGRPTPEEAVAPYAGAPTLVSQEVDGATTVLALRADETVFRVFQVTKRDDGWWPDGYRECSS